MRIVPIRGSVEIWPGRKLYMAGDQLLQLPKGYMSVERRVVSFGNASKTTVQLVCLSEGVAAAVFRGIAEMEKPEEGQRLFNAATAVDASDA